MLVHRCHLTSTLLDWRWASTELMIPRMGGDVGSLLNPWAIGGQILLRRHVLGVITWAKATEQIYKQYPKCWKCYWWGTQSRTADSFQKRWKWSVPKSPASFCNADTMTLYRKYSQGVRILKLAQVLTLRPDRQEMGSEGLMVHTVSKSLIVVCQGLLIIVFKFY